MCGSGSIAPPVLTLALNKVSGELHAPSVLSLEKKAPGTH
jgi:hypothetical protein